MRRIFAGLLAAPGYTGTFVIMLAVLFASFAAVASLNALLLVKDLPYKNADRLIEVRARITAGGHELTGTSPGFARAWGEALGSRASHALERTSAGYLRLNGQDELIELAYVDRGFFELLGLELAAGGIPREVASGPSPVVLSTALASALFPSASDAVGRFVQIDGSTHPVIAVMSADAVSLGQLRGRDEQLWLVNADVEAQREQWGNFSSNVHLLVKPKAGLAMSEIQAIVGPLTAQLARTSAAGSVPPDFAITPEVLSLRDAVLGSSARAGVVMMTATVLLCLLALSVLVTLGAARLANARPLLEVHAALGAKTNDLARLVAVELFILCTASVLIARPLGAACLKVIRELGNESLPRLVELRLEPLSLLIPYALALLCSFAVGYRVALGIRRQPLAHSSSSGGKGAIGGLSRKFRRGLLSSQFLLVAFALFIASALLVDSGRRLSADPGYRDQGSVYIQIELPEPMTAAGEKVALEPRLTSALTAATGGNQYALVDMPPVSTGLALSDVRRATGDLVGQMQVNGVSERYLPGLGFRLVAGRYFAPEDIRRKSRVAVLGETAASLVSNGAVGVGGTLLIGGQPYTVIGVVNDVVNPVATADGAKLQVYIPFEHSDGVPTLSFFVFGTDVADKAAVAKAVRAVDPSLIVGEVMPTSGLLGELLAAYRIKAAIAVALALFALTGAVAGTTAVIAYMFRLSSPEMALRAALGARTGDLTKFLSSTVLLPVCAAIAVFGVGVAATLPTWARVLEVDRATAALLAVVGAGTVLLLVVATAAALARQKVAGQMNRALQSLTESY